VDWGEKPSLLNLNKIQDLHFIREKSETVEIGPLITHTELTQNHIVQTFVPALAKAVLYIGSPQIRNRGTVVGNMVHASPAADSLPILYSRNARIQIQTKEETHLVPIDEFIVGPGEVVIPPQGIVTCIVVPKLPNYVGEYLTLRQRQALSGNVVSVGVEMLKDNSLIQDIRIALGAVSPTVVRGRKTETLLTNKMLNIDLIKEAGQMIQTECIPIDDVRSNKEYRKAMTGVLLTRFLRSYIHQS